MKKPASNMDVTRAIAGHHAQRFLDKENGATQRKDQQQIIIT